MLKSLFSRLFPTNRRSKKPARAAKRLRIESLEDRQLLATLATGTLQPVYSQPSDSTGNVYKSAWYAPDGLDGDAYVYDAFTLASSKAIQEIDWRGGYTNNKSGAGVAPVYDFTIKILPSIAAGIQPDIIATPLATYHVGNNAGETPYAMVGSEQLYDYHYALPTTFQAQAGTKYWLQIEASQGVTPTYGWPPDWGLASASGGDGSHFNAITGGTNGGGTLYYNGSGDAAFTLLSSSGPTSTISVVASPNYAGTIQGAGPYSSGAVAQLIATSNTGYGFVNWTENGKVVSSSPNYTFTVNGDRNLVANFTTAATISVGGAPNYGGTVSGGGIFNSGTSTTVTATPASGFDFVDWTWLGTPVSTSPQYTFTATTDEALVANFAPAVGTATFDFDTGTPAVSVYQTMPADQTVDGVTAHFSSPTFGAGGFSVQSDQTTFFHLSQFSANYLYPNSVYNPALDVTFDQPVTGIAFTYATADFQQTDVPSTVQVTAYDATGAVVGSASGHGTYAGDTMPMGRLSFNSAQPFTKVEIKIPPAPLAASDMLVDNITVTGAQVAPVAPTLLAGGDVFSYDGTSHAATALALASDGITPVAGTYSVLYNGSSNLPVDAGTYNVDVSFTSSDPHYTDVTASGALTILQASPWISVDPTPVAYDGKAHAATVTALGVDGATPVAGSFIVTYNGSATLPVNAGTYSVVANYTSSDSNYTAAVGNGTLTIGKATPAFSNLKSASITLGSASTTLSGHLAAGAAIPVGDSVSITLNGLTQTAVVDASGNFSSSFATGKLPAGSYTITYAFAGDAGNFNAAANGAGTLSVTGTATKPVVSTSPVSQTVVAGNPVTFTASATGNPAPGVQWQVSTDGGKTYANLAGAASNTLSFTAAASQNGNRYRAVFTNTAGTATTAAATLTVQSAPVVTTNPTSQTVKSGSSVTFTAAATSNPKATVQWQVSTNGGLTFANISGATSTSYSVKGAATNNGYAYRAVFTNSLGSATTSAAVLTVQWAPVVTTSPTSQTVKAGTSVTFTASASGNPAPMVQWQVSTDGGVTYTNIFGETNTSLTFVATSGQKGCRYRAVFTNVVGTATTKSATLTVA